MVHLDGINVGVAVVRDAETGQIRYAKNHDEIADWAKTVEVNGAWITARTYGGKTVVVRDPNADDGLWYDADHAEFMDAIFKAEAALGRMLAARGIRTKVEGEE